MGNNQNKFNEEQITFVELINKSPVEDYPAFLQSYVKAHRFSEQNLLMVLFESNSPHLWSRLSAKSDVNPGLSVDQRVLAWFQACEQLPMDVSKVINEQAGVYQRNFLPPIRSMLSAHAIQTTRWWRENGLDDVLFLEDSSSYRQKDKIKTNLASLAFHWGMVDVVTALLPGSKLLHQPLLWKRLMLFDLQRKMDALGALLLNVGNPPKDFWQESSEKVVLSVRNEKSVMAFFNRLIEDGRAPLSVEDATRYLDRLAKDVRSKSSLVLFDWLLDHGANPVGPEMKEMSRLNLSGRSVNPLVSALYTWVQMNYSSNLRPVQHQLICRLFDALPSEMITEVFTPEVVKDIESRLLKKAEPSRLPGLGKDALRQQAVKEDIALFRRILLPRLSVRSDSSSSPRPKM